MEYLDDSAKADLDRLLDRMLDNDCPQTLLLLSYRRVVTWVSFGYLTWDMKYRMINALSLARGLRSVA